MTAQGSGATIGLAAPGGPRSVAYLRAAGTGVEIRTPWRRAPLDDGSQLAVAGELARAAAELTRFDLRPGRLFRVLAPFARLPRGAELELYAVDEHKPSGRDIYVFRHAEQVVELLDAEPGEARLLDRLSRHLAALPAPRTRRSRNHGKARLSPRAAR